MVSISQAKKRHLQRLAKRHPRWQDLRDLARKHRMIANKVKLVVWDLDDTFWQGTLGEGAIVENSRNIEIVRALARRGIPSAICSKNDFGAAKAKLEALGIWDHFVFARIAFQPKGQAVAEIVEAAALRAQNVLFIDDHASNLEEAGFFSPGLMTARPQDVLDGLLDHPHLAGKPDPDLAQLEKYRVLDRKHESRRAGALSNEDFLRASRIRIEIGYDIETDFERIVELVNRANQLNYTKRRLETHASIDAFRAKLRRFHIHAGTVRASDAHGDYGLIGFFLLRQSSNEKRLVHFVFSCRTMNMGIEQHVYEMLGCPDIDIAGPVAYGLQTHARVDWIEEARQGAVAQAPSRPLVLIGGCDLLQLASYCSSNRLEFVNVCRGDVMMRFDDPGFVLSDAAAVADCAVLRRLPAWQHEDRVRFDAGLAACDIVLVSMWPAMNGVYIRTRGGVLLRLIKKQVASVQRDGKRSALKPLVDDVESLPLDDMQILALIQDAFDAIAKRSQATIFVLGCNTRAGIGIDRKQRYNDACRAYCARSGPRFHFVDIDAVVAEEHLLDDDVHLARAGYHALARHILERADGVASSVLA
jgi:FkbH-like protein